MLKFLLGAMTGGVFGVTAMCLFQAAGESERRFDMTEPPPKSDDCDIK